MTLSELARSWRTEADRLRERYARPDLAALAEAHAGELEEAMRAAADETLTLAEASAESGYAERTLREMLAQGRVPQAGRRGRPRIRRGDLPRRAQGGGSEWDAGEHVRSIVGRG